MDLALPHRHLDPKPQVLDYLLPYILEYDAQIYTLEESTLAVT